MGINGTGADDELFGYLDVVQPSCHQSQHLHLSGGQSGGIARGSLRCDIRWPPDAICVDPAAGRARVSTCSIVIVFPSTHAAAWFWYLQACMKIHGG